MVYEKNCERISQMHELSLLCADLACGSESDLLEQPSYCSAVWLQAFSVTSHCYSGILCNIFAS